MPKIIGVDIPGKKRIEYSLRYIHGIGFARAQEIVKKAGIDPAKSADALTSEEMIKLTGIIQEGYMLEGDLRRDVSQNIRRLISIGSHRGIRHRKGLPVRGQRTHTNARTRKGVRRTVGVVKIKETKAVGAPAAIPGRSMAMPSKAGAPTAARATSAAAPTSAPAAKKPAKK